MKSEIKKKSLIIKKVLIEIEKNYEEILELLKVLENLKNLN